MSALKNKKEITYDELSWFMKPFAQHGESNLARIEWRSAKLLDRGEQSINFAPCSSSRHAFFDRISRDACKQRSGCNINYLTFLRSYLWMVIRFTALNTINIHKLCSNDRFVIWLARAHWQDRKLKAMSCWEFQSLMNLVMIWRIELWYCLN